LFGVNVSVFGRRCAGDKLDFGDKAVARGRDQGNDVFAASLLEKETGNERQSEGYETKRRKKLERGCTSGHFSSARSYSTSSSVASLHRVNWSNGQQAANWQRKRNRTDLRYIAAIIETSAVTAVRVASSDAPEARGMSEHTARKAEQKH
jgi:hypothetical protein